MTNPIAENCGHDHGIEEGGVEPAWTAGQMIRFGPEWEAKERDLFGAALNALHAYAHHTNCLPGGNVIEHFNEASRQRTRMEHKPPLTSGRFRDALKRAVALADQTIPPGNEYTAAWEKAHGFSNRFVADLAKAVFDLDDALDDLTAEGS